VGRGVAEVGGEEIGGEVVEEGDMVYLMDLGFGREKEGHEGY
jgi:hypothetical protein